MAADPRPSSPTLPPYPSSPSSGLPILVPAPPWVPLPELLPAVPSGSGRGRGRGRGAGGEGDTTTSATEAPRLPQDARFHPTDRQLVDYLVRKTMGQPVPAGIITDDIDLCALDVGTLRRLLRSGSDQRAAYFFAHRNVRNVAGGRRPGLPWREGYWRPAGKGGPIPDSFGAPVGYKRTLDFYGGKPPAGRRTGWRMEEFRLNLELDMFRNHRQTPEQMNSVLCKVYERRTGSSTATAVTLEQRINQEDESLM